MKGSKRIHITLNNERTTVTIPWWLWSMVEGATEKGAQQFFGSLTTPGEPEHSWYLDATGETTSISETMQAAAVLMLRDR